MKEKKSTINRLFEFAESYDTDITFIALMFVLLAIVIAVPITLLNKIAWAFCAPLALILVYMIAKGILDLIQDYRWYFGLNKDKYKSKQNQNQ
jgi:phage shock protein PspC (stress-responsive transcriptional regulator)